MLGRNFFAYLFMCLFSSLVFAVGGDMGGGIDPNIDGSADCPYLIEDFNDFQEFCSDPNYWASGVYTRLECNLDLDPNLPGREVYTQAPIGYGTLDFFDGFNGKAYAGYFDGNCHFINNLTIESNDCIGLFGYTIPSASVSNLGIKNANIIGETDSCCIGGLVGCNNGIITNCYTKGTISGNSNLGGLVGKNGDFNAYFSLRNCRIANSYSNAKVSGNQVVGGLVGDNYGRITSSYSTGLVSGDEYFGGLASWNIGIITNSYWDVQTSGKLTSAGGISKTTVQMKDAATFVGFNDGSWAIDQGNDYPRLAWEGAVGSPLTTDYPSRTYTGLGTESEPFILVDANDIVCMSMCLLDWSSCFILANDIDMSPVLDYSPVVDFSGSLDGQGFIISNLVVDCQIIGNRFQLGLIGRLSGNISNLGIEDCNIISEKISMSVGGLCGDNKGNIENCHSGGSVYGDIFVGGLVGTNSDDSIVTDSHSSGTVRGEGGIGGLVGWNVGGNVTNSYSTSSAISNSNCAGGLIGENQGDVTSCYSTGVVSGNESIGGLLGNNRLGSVISSFSTGTINGNSFVGGLIGYNGRGLVSKCFWDTVICQTDIAYVERSIRYPYVYSPVYSTAGVAEGKTTFKMQTESTFTNAGWDFMDIWDIGENQTYPFLRKYRGSDLDQDGTVNFADFVIIADNWLVGVE